MNPFRSIRLAPITVGLIWLACLLFVGVFLETTDDPVSRRRALRDWGAGLPMIMIQADSSDSQFEEVAGSSGPMQVWDGQWWRLLVNNLHHGGLIHLLMNGCAMIYLGRIIEKRMSASLYLLFLVSSMFCVAAASGLTGELGIGLSGIAYAQVGLLMVWRDRDESVGQEFTFTIILFAGFWLMLCQILTYTHILHIANVSHYTGLIYGWIWGQVYLETRQRGLFRFLFGVGHLLLYPAFWFILHPFWLGSWHWYQSQELDLLQNKMQHNFNNATQQERPQIEQQLMRLAEIENSESWQRRKTERLQTALLLEPSIEVGWLELSLLYARNGDRRLALRTALEGLKRNRGSAKLLHRVVDLWVDDERSSRDSDVPEIVEQVFGEEADVWGQKLAARVSRQQRISRQAEAWGQWIRETRFDLLTNALERLFTEPEPNAPNEIPAPGSQPAIPQPDPSPPYEKSSETVP